MVGITKKITWIIFEKWVKSDNTAIFYLSIMKKLLVQDKRVKKQGKWQIEVSRFLTLRPFFRATTFLPVLAAIIVKISNIKTFIFSGLIFIGLPESF